MEKYHLIVNNNNNVLFCVLFLRMLAHYKAENPNSQNEHARIHACTHMCIHMHAHTHTHTHMYMHTVNRIAWKGEVSK